ncbi:MAG: DegT/DnrJ/EryC1/StrS family aminotransferase [Rhodospirillales bacterium]|nr:DegT/DnrJ/EryC1/StrS family aminotransferase [Rhodospirillales bacterium]
MPFVDLKAQYARLKPGIDARIHAVLDHGRYILGPEVAELEAELCRVSGARHAVGVASGTDALLVALMAESIGPGDAVFLPAFTFPATAEVVCCVGAEPVFAEVEAETFNIDVADLERRIDAVRRKGRLRPRAVIAVDLYGLPADYDAVRAVSDRHGLFVIADAAQSFGARRGGRGVGTLAPVTAVSFYPAKPLGGYGDGGAILTDDDGRADLLRSLRVHGEGGGQYDIVRIGRNARLDTLQAAILLAKLEAFAEDLAARNAVAGWYDCRLDGIVATPGRPPETQSAWAQYTLVLDSGERDRVRNRLKAEGVPTMVYYPAPLHLQPAFARFGGGSGSLPVSEDLCRRVVSLPIHPDLDEGTVDRIAEAVRRAVA